MQPKFRLGDRVKLRNGLSLEGTVVSRTLALPPYRYGIAIDGCSVYNDVAEEGLLAEASSAEPRTAMGVVDPPSR